MDRANVPRGQLARNSFDVSVHVRHGDKWDEMTLVDDHHYVNVVRLIRKILGRDVSVFLLTDDEFTVEAFHRVEGIQLFHLKYPYREYNYQETFRTLGTKAVLYALADIWIACHARRHVGTFQSNVDRAIVEVNAVQFAMASELYFEIERPCVSAAHCRDVGFAMDYRAHGFANAGRADMGVE